jgi:uncharacterized membrane protein
MQKSIAPPENSTQPEWRWWHFLLLLSLLGPILAPLFRTIGAQPFTGVANFIYWLGNLVCPLPDANIVLFGQPMAVCPLCYSALIAITVISLSYPLPARFYALWHRLAWPAQLGAILLLIVPWLALYSVFQHSQAGASQTVMLLIGLLGGTGVALLGEMLAGLIALPKEAAR